jgi:hypothetical protein
VVKIETKAAKGASVLPPMELLMIYKISPDPSLPKRGKKWKSLLKRGREKAEMTHSITRSAF